MVNPTRAVFAASLAAASAAAAIAQSPPALGQNFHKLRTIDSLDISWAALSPDQKWLAMSATEGGGSYALYTARADGTGKVNRITTPGFSDRYPYWFASSDRLVFTSNRLSRTGRDQFFVTTIAIDPATGLAAGPPRQISTDPAWLAGYPSPDGQWIPYTTLDLQELRIVPANGGQARTIAKASSVEIAVWAADSKSVFARADRRSLTEPDGRGGIPIVGGNGWDEPPVGLLRIPISGGTPRLVARNDRGNVLFPLPSQPSTLLWGDAGSAGLVRHFELRDSSARILGSTSIPALMRPFISTGLTSGVLGLLHDETYNTHVVSLDGSKHRVIRGIWADGWREDGRGFYVARLNDEANPFVGITDTSGRIDRRVALPTNRRFLWEGIADSGVTLRAGDAATQRQNSTLYLADLRSGKLLPMPGGSASSLSFRITGRGGAQNVDGAHFLVTERQRETVRVVDQTRAGSRRPLRDLPMGSKIRAVAVHGDRIAWTEETNDSVRVMVARGLRGPANRVAVVSAKSPTVELAWSWSGEQLAANIPPSAAPSTMLVLRIGEDGSLKAPVQRVDLGMAREPWGCHWTRDDKQLACVASIAGQEREELLLFQVASGGGPLILSKNDPEVIQDEPMISPDGKQIAYPTSVPRSQTIYRVDFLPPKK